VDLNSLAMSGEFNGAKIDSLKNRLLSLTVWHIGLEDDYLSIGSDLSREVSIRFP